MSVNLFPPSPFTKPKLKIAHLNIQSMKNRNHLIQARHLVKEKDYDVLTISETWFNSTVKNTDVELEGYKLFRLDRLHKVGGRCMCLCEIQHQRNNS